MSNSNRKTVAASRGSRRRFLQGIGGAAMALPWMESLARAEERTAAARPAMRMAHYYIPIGVVRRGFFPVRRTM